MLCGYVLLRVCVCVCATTSNLGDMCLAAGVTTQPCHRPAGRHAVIRLHVLALVGWLSSLSPLLKTSDPIELGLPTGD